MKHKKLFFLLLIAIISAFWSCQKDIPLLGEDNTDSSKTEVFITSIALTAFNLLDPGTSLPWDDGSVQSFDSLDYTGPDIYFNYYYKSDTAAPMMFKQLSHFQNANASIVTAQSPLVYYLTAPYQIPSYYIDTTFYLKMYDLDYNVPLSDSTLMDSIAFKIGPATKTNPYLQGTGYNGSLVTVGVLWK